MRIIRPPGNPPFDRFDRFAPFDRRGRPQLRDPRAPAGATRREFLRGSVCAAVGATAIVRTLFDLRRVAAAASLPLSGAAAGAAAGANDYRALVCVFLYGGNDGNNTIVPRGADYAGYAQGRGILAIPESQLLAVTPATPDGRLWGLHPSLGGLQSLFGSGKAALVGNVGPLVQPVTRSEYLAGTAALPPQLFSHSDQTVHWQTSLPDQPPQTGWGGRIADLLHTLNQNQQVSMSISLGGSNTLQVGNQVTQYSMSPDGTISLVGYDPDPATQDPFSRGASQLLDASYGNLFERGFRDITQRALDNDALLSSVLAGIPDFAGFPPSNLGDQLHMVAKLIAARDAIGVRRQVFFCAAGGYDTHGAQLQAHSNLLSELDGALAAFYNATVTMGIPDSVTAFTASDFGRTWPTNGEGSDHGWGNHQFVVGGAVRGGDLYGAMPVLVEDGPDDTHLGRWIPTTAVDEYASTLALWFGVAPGEVATILPNIGRFGTSDMGFMS